MKLPAISSLVGAFFLLAFVQLLAALAGSLAAALCAIGLGLVAAPLFGFLQISTEVWWIPVALIVAASAAGVGVRSLGSLDPASGWFWLAPLLAAATLAIVLLVRQASARRCGLCRRRIGSGVALECPRCALLVCEWDCWNFESCRCRQCLENKVPIFSPDGRWWDRQLGPRVTFGRCQLCQTAAAETDLRGCRRCGRPQCRPCWDDANGQCSRCQWVVEDLPPSLAAYVIVPGREAPQSQ